jgi:hypothetical protein
VGFYAIKTAALGYLHEATILRLADCLGDTLPRQSSSGELIVGGLQIAVFPPSMIAMLDHQKIDELPAVV